MSEQRHARAPWSHRVSLSKDGFTHIVTDEGRAMVASIWPNGAFENSEANALLIAAAPQLLEACERALAALNEHDTISCRKCNKATSLIEKAVEKATGEPIR